MSGDVAEDEAVLDVRVPMRRRRASDDEGEEAEFHDAAEYAASVADSQGHGDNHGAAEPNGEDDHVMPDGEPVGDEEEATGTDEAPGEDDKVEQLAGKKAKLREPFEVPTSGAFWLHDDRFGEEEAPAEAPRVPAERKNKSDTDGRWLHDKFGKLELGEEAGDDSSESAFSHFKRGRGRGMRGGRHGGGRGPPMGGRGRGGSLGRGGHGYGSASADGYGSELGEVVVAAGPAEPQVALPQRPPRAPRATPRNFTPPASSYSDDAGAAAAPPYPGGRGRGRGVRGGRSGEVSGRGRRDSFNAPEEGGPREGGPREYGSGAEASGGVYGRGYGRGRGGGGRDDGFRGAGGRNDGFRGRDDGFRGAGGRDDGFRVDGASRGGYGSGGRGGRGYGRGSDFYDRDSGAGGAGSNGGTFEAGRGRGRGMGRPPLGEGYGRGSGPGRGAGGGRGPPPFQQRQQVDTPEEEFPPLPGSMAGKAATVSLILEADPHTSGGAGSRNVDAGPPGISSVRRYSKMAGKGGDGGGGAAAEGGRARGGGGEGGGGNRTSKLSAAAPTFEPTPPAAAGQAGRQQGDKQQQGGPPPPQQQPQPPPAPSVPMAFGAPLQPMPPVQQLPPPAPMGGVPDAYGAPLQPQGQPMQYMQQQQSQSYSAPMQVIPQQSMMGGPLGMAQPGPPGMQPQYAAGSAAPYGSYHDMETWFQDAYQKALATGMDSQQAYSAVQGYVRGMQMAFETLASAQQRGAYPGALPLQGPPPGQ